MQHLLFFMYVNALVYLVAHNFMVLDLINLYYDMLSL